MNNVVQFARTVDEPHGSGEAFCIGCNHTWQAVAPTGVTELECPECKTMKGRYTFAYAPPVSHVWECNCGNQLFNIAAEGIFCPNCGVFQDYSKVFP